MNVADYNNNNNIRVINTRVNIFLLNNNKLIILI